MYDIENSLADLSAEKRLQERRNRMKPLVNSLFDWAKKTVAKTEALPKGKTAKLNHLSVYNYLDYLLTELPKLLPDLTDKEGNVNFSKLDPLLPWSDQLPEKCHKPSR